MKKITNCLWFNDDAEEAIEFYCSLFPNSKRGAVTRCPKGAPLPEGTLFTATFELLGREYMALNGGPMFKFTEAFSMVVHCDTQQEIDDLWEKLGAGGQRQQCGWLKDRFGLSWQIVPSVLEKLMVDPDQSKVGRMSAALMQMDKLDVASLQAAFDGR
jgi:predicted 3-demethylubiquinone-9 3-methyltransferase (glyoxalase superfamily)